MKSGIFEITDNTRLADGVYRIVLSGDASALTRPGQFVEIALPGYFLRRPISVCDWDEGSITLLYKVVGHGTDWLSKCEAWQTLDVLSGLGNGFSVPDCGDAPLLVGGGIGIAPLYGLAKRLIAAGKKPSAILGFNTAAETFYTEEFRALGMNVTVTTADGTAGVRGFVTDALPDDFDIFCACGPMPMLRALAAATDRPGLLSLEARMGCGFGACMGCTIETVNGPRRVCKEGPVFRKEELIW